MNDARAHAARRYEALDGWRGLFAVALVFHHLRIAGHFFERPFVLGSYLAVDFFFVLSGFVITHSARGRLGDARALGQFMWRRFARLWPLHAFVLLLFIALEGAKYLAASHGSLAVDVPAFAAGSRFDARVLPAHFLLVQGLGMFSMPTWNGPSWSISSEFWTYLVFALATLLLRGRTVVFALLLALGAQLLLLRSVRTMDTDWDFGFARCLLGFSLGHLTYRAHQRLPGVRMRAWGLLELAGTGAAIAFIALAGRSRWSLAAPLLFAPIVLLFAYEGGALSRLLKSAPIAALGRWSYAIYMTHELLLLCLNRGLRFAGRRLGFEPFQGHLASTSDPPVDFAGVWQMDGLALLALGAVLCVSALAYRLLERPAQSFLGRLLRRPAAATSDSSAVDIVVKDGAVESSV